MIKQFLAAINQLCVEKNIPRDKVVDAVAAALKTAYKKDYGTREQDIEVELDEETGNFTIYLVKQVVDTVEDDEIEISVKDAKKYRKDAKDGDEIHIDVTPSGFGRIAAQAAKQVILQRVQEAERDVLFETFKEREDELLTAQVARVDRGQVYIEVDRNTVPFPREERVYSEKYYVGQRLKVYLEKVEKTNKGPRLVISRRSPKLVEKLFEFEIPEVKSGVVEIKGIAREAGTRTKIAVASNDEKIDPIGACVGQKGVRIQTIMDELNNEMIDVVEYNAEAEKFITQSLAPAKIAVIELNKKENIAEVYVESDQRPLAIGRNGQNVKLASMLTGFEINLHDVEEYDGKKKPVKKVVEGQEGVDEDTIEEDTTPTPKAGSVENFEDLPISDAIKEKLQSGGITTIEMLKQMKVEDLTQIGGIGQVSAEKIKEAVGE